MDMLTGDNRHMDREQGLQILTQHGWLSTTPTDFQRAVLTHSHWEDVEAGAPIQNGGEETGEMIGLAQGAVAMRTVSDTPLLHVEHAVSWFGYLPIVSRRPRVVAVDAHTSVWLARTPQWAITQALDERPEWWPHLLELLATYSYAVTTVAADLMIRSSERRCAAVLARLAGCRFAGPEENAPVEIAITQEMLAAAAGLSRNSTGTALRKLMSRGLVEPGYGGITVWAPAALRAFVELG